MDIYTSYSVKIKEYNHIFEHTVRIYRHAVSFFLDVCIKEWEYVVVISGANQRMCYIESLTIPTAKHPDVPFSFPSARKEFYKMPVYLRRAAINEALGIASSYVSNLKNWEESDRSGNPPHLPEVIASFPCLYRNNMFIQTGSNTARIKVYTRNTWDWLDVTLRNTDCNYIAKHCKLRKECVPTLTKRGKQWFLTFPFKETVTLSKTEVRKQVILAVDLGINNACTVSVMTSDGTILERRFLRLTRDEDCLIHSMNRIKKAQKHGNRHLPRLWAKVNGINHDISVKTAHFIMKVAEESAVDVIVFEHLDFHGNRKGKKKQRLHLWKSREVQSLVSNKAHRLGIHVNTVNARNTSKLAYDGSGEVLRGKTAGLPSYSLCTFPNGRQYNCDLNASYNIGARYFIREILREMPAKARLHIEAEVPECCKRSTCTFSTLIHLHAVLAS